MTFADYQIRLVKNIIAAAEVRSATRYDLPRTLRKVLEAECLPALVRQRRIGRTFKGRILSATSESHACRRLEASILTRHFGGTAQGSELVWSAISRSRFTVKTLTPRKARRAHK